MAAFYFATSRASAWVDTMRLGCVLAQALGCGWPDRPQSYPSNQYQLPGFSSVPSHARMCVATRSRNIRSWLMTTEQPGTRAAPLRARQRLDVEVVRGLVEKQRVAALLERKRQVQTVCARRRRARQRASAGPGP